MPDFNLMKCERDAVSFLGLLSFAYLTWDPAIPSVDLSGHPESTHFHGLNIRALIVDNGDGSVLALEANTIHAHESPLFHAEQACLRSANDVLRTKRPRLASTSVENYYRSQLFYEAGSSDEDFARKGCTLYSTLEPCPMCTSTICVCRVKRTAFIIPDLKYGGSYGAPASPGIKDKYYPSYAMRFEQFLLSGSSTLVQKATPLYASLFEAISALRTNGVSETLFLDTLHDLLSKAFNTFVGLSEADIQSTGSDHDNVANTLHGLFRLCNISK